jgi:hypothetical protein
MPREPTPAMNGADTELRPEPPSRGGETAPEATRRVWLLLEWLVLLVLTPLLVWPEVVRVSKFAAFAVPVIYAFVVHGRHRPPQPERGADYSFRGALVRFVVLAPPIGAYVWFRSPVIRMPGRVALWTEQDASRLTILPSCKGAMGTSEGRKDPKRPEKTA